MKDLIIDLFAGGGGASVGIEMALGRQVDIAVNPNPIIHPVGNRKSNPICIPIEPTDAHCLEKN